MKILLTGATGFLGNHLLRRLLAEGHEVSILKRSQSNCSRIHDVLANCHVYDADLLSIETAFAAQKIDVVIHCATAYGRGAMSAVEVIQSNLQFPLALLDCCIQYGVRFFLNTDTFFSKQIPDRLDSLSPLYMPEYTLSKYQFVQWGKMRAAEGKLTFVNLRLEHVYGPQDNSDKFVSFLLRSMSAGGDVLELTDGIQIRDLIHVDDVVEAYMHVLGVLEQHEGYCQYEVGTGVSHTIRELVEHLKDELSAKTQLQFGALPRKAEEIMYSTADIRTLKRIGWRSKHSCLNDKFTFTPPQNTETEH